MDIEYTFEDEILDVEPYEEAPDFDAPQTDDAGGQDDGEIMQGMNFMAKVANAIRTWVETLLWLKGHRTTHELGFNPDGLCLKVTRLARNIPAKYLTAKEAQDNTPQEHRVYDVADLRRGMAVFFDDPRDSNRAGHVVTMVGRVRDFDIDRLEDCLFDTNSVKSGEIVTVRGDYFGVHWGDHFRFGATMLNGVEIDVPGHKSRIERFNSGGPVYNLNLLQKAFKAGRPKAGMILQRIETQIKRLPDNPKLLRVREFKDGWRDTRTINMQLLDDAVAEGRVGLVKQVRDEIRRLIGALPDE